jgi:hypothetical protein
MKRLFFDISNTTRNLYDYQGREFERFEEARELAELIALDLQCSELDDWAGSEVKVRNIDGNCLISIPIQESDLIAA